MCIRYFNFSVKRSKYLSNLFSVITTSTIILITVLSLAFYFNAQNFIERALYDSYFDEFVRTKSILESLTEDMRSHLTYLNTTKDAQTLINSDEIQRSTERKALNSISKYRNSNSIIHSIYFYNKNLDRYYIISNQNHIRDKVFFDEEITKIIKNPMPYDFSEPISRTIPKAEFSASDKINVFTYILPENYSSQSQEKSYTIINVLADDILKYLFSNSQETGTSAFFYDIQKKSLICSGFSEYLPKDSSLLGNKIAHFNTDSGYFIYKDKDLGKKYFTAYTKLDSPFWCMVKLTPYDTVATHINNFRITTLVIVLLMIILSLFYCIFTSKKLYKPIRTVFEKIQEITNDYSQKNFSSVSESIDALHEELSHLNNFKQKNAYIIKNEILKNFIFSGSENDFSMLNSVKNNTESVVLVIIKIDNYNTYMETYSYSDRMLYKYSFINIVEEIIGNHFKCDFIDISEENIAGIIRVSNLSNDLLGELFSRFKKALTDNFNISASVFISKIVHLPANLSDIYENLYGISLYRFHFGKGCILFLDNFNEDSFKNIPVDSVELKPLISEIKMHHYDASIAELHNIIQKIFSLNYTAAKISVYHLLTDVFSTLATIEKNFNHSLEINYTTLFDKIANKAETLEEIEAEFTVLLNCAFNAINVRKTNKVQLLISQVCDYVANNYSDVNLSSVTIADSIKLSARYLTKIFSENTSTSLSNYITNYRIEKSKEYLLNTNLSVKEIVNKIGWINLKYFYTMFKKATGVTPGEFRTSGEQKAKNNNN